MKSEERATNTWPALPQGNGTTIMNIYISEGKFDLQGRVEVRKNGIWGTICNDNTDEEK